MVGMYVLADATTEEGTTTETKTEDITLTVGETAQRVLSNEQSITGTHNPSVATVTATYDENTSQTTTTCGNKVTSFTTNGTTGVISDGTNYLVVDSSGDISSTTDVSAATQFTVQKSSSSYTIKMTSGNYYLYVESSGNNGNKKYTLGTKNSEPGKGWSYDSSEGFYRTSGGGKNTSYYLVYSGSEWCVQTSSSNAGFLYAVTETTTTGPATTITFKGLKAGTTNVTVGNVTYHITVTDMAPTNAMTESSITLEYWITNAQVTASNSTSQTISSTCSGITSDNGVALTALAPTSGTWGEATVYYWRTVRLDTANKQTGNNGVDRTSSGTTLTHIRYHNGAWQYKTESGTWTYFLSSDQLVAYYLQKTEVTKEITTYVKDWGYSTSGETDDTSNGTGQVALTVAVVYPDGTVSPAEGKMYANSTTIFNYWDGRDIGIVAPVNNSDYNISKITVTDGKRNSNFSANVWYTTDTITWTTKTLDSGKKWYAETTVWDKTEDAGTTPMVNGKTNDPQITWSAKNTAKLVLIYLEPIVKETNLNLVYYDQTNQTEIARTQIVMAYNQGDTEPSYKTALKNASGNVIGTTTSWPGKTSSENDYLPDDAYVTNSSSVKQTFNKELTTVQITGISDVYKTGLYKYNGAGISTDGKTLTLYYVLDDAALSKTYVVDYGLPVTIYATEFIKESVQATSVTITNKDSLQFGTVSVADDKSSITYTPKKILTDKETIALQATFAGGQTQTFAIAILPASTMYYEESPFVTFADGSGLSGATWSQQTSGTPTTAGQALSALGDKAQYGYDEAYESMTEYSMNTAQKVTVTSGMTGIFSTNTAASWPTATFTFKGTGFDVISLTNNTSGAIAVTVYKGTGTRGTVEKKLFIDNYYGYTQDEAGNWIVNTESNNTLYQIPVMKVSGLTYDTYTAVITVFYDGLFSHTNTTKSNGYSFWLDAIRIYDPMGKDYSAYTQDNEGYPQYTNFHDLLVKDATSKRAVFIDGAASANVETYKSYGPNNEVYLAKGQAIAFNIPTGGTIATVQVGAKALSGSPTMSITVGTGTESALTKELDTATDMYYTIPSAQAGSPVTISNTSTTDGAVLSLTNLKITYSAKPEAEATTFAALSDDDTANALMVVRSVFAAEAPVIEPFVPERFEAKWDRSVRAGQRATLTVKTSEDVAAITVDGQTIDTYRTYTERSGRGWNATRVTYRVFTYTVTPTETTDYTVSALSSDGAASTPITATLTVTTQRASGWWGRWS